MLATGDRFTIILFGKGLKQPRVCVSSLCYLVKLFSLFPACAIYIPFVNLLTFVALSNFPPFLVYSPFMLSTHPINVPAPHTKQHNSHFRLIVHTRSARIHPLQLNRRLWPPCYSDVGELRHDWGVSTRTNSNVIGQFKNERASYQLSIATIPSTRPASHAKQ